MKKGEWRTGDFSNLQRLETLAKYRPIFTGPGFSFATFVSPKESDDGVITMGWASFGPEADSFLKDASDYGWVQGTDWLEWSKTREAEDLCSKPEALAAAGINDLAKLITARFRADRFIKAHWRWTSKAGC